MDPVSGLGAGTKLVKGRLAFYVGVQLASVLAPGIVIIGETWYFVTRIEHSKISLQLKGADGPFGLLVLIVVLAGGYVAGYVARELAFKAVGRLERLPRFRDRLNEDQTVHLARYSTDEQIKDLLQAHPYVGGTPEATERRRTGGAHVEDVRYANFIYAKMWLRRYAPELGLDTIEAEINILASTLIPAVVGGFALLAALHFRWWSYFLAIAACVLICTLILDALLRLRRSERFESMRNLLMDHAMRRAAAGYPAAAPAEE